MKIQLVRITYKFKQKVTLWLTISVKSPRWFLLALELGVASEVTSFLVMLIQIYSPQSNLL